VIRKWPWFLLVVFVFTGVVFSAGSVAAAVQDLDKLAEEAAYRYEEQVTDYKEVEKTGFRDVARTEYRDVEVEKTGYRDVVKYRGEKVDKLVPYSREVPVFDWVITGYTAKKGSIIHKSSKDKDDNCIEVRTKDKWYTCALLNKETKLTKVNNLFGKADVSYVTYGNVPKTTYTYKTKQKTQAYPKANSQNKLTARDAKGKKVNVQVAKDKKMTKVNDKWYKTSLKYTDYKKVNNKWVKQTKSTTVYIPAKQVKATSKTAQVWTKQTKKTVGYFRLDVTDTKKTRKWQQTGTRVEKGNEWVTETVQIPYTDKEPYTYTEMETEEYTYTESEPYTYVEEVPVYETVKVENSLQDKYKSVVNYYWGKRLTESELHYILDTAGVKYQVVNGYDHSRFVSGVVTVNGVSRAYSFTPSTRVKLLVFSDGSAVNLSYLMTVPNKKYTDVSIGKGSYVVN